MMRLGMFGVCCLLVSGCAPQTEPQVEIVDVQPLAIAPAVPDQDDVKITVRYTDSDGDLGGGEALVIDCRGADLVTTLRIPKLVKDGAASVPISGTFTLHISGVAALPQPTSVHSACTGVVLREKSVVFCVVLRDEKGSVSLPACTAGIPLLETSISS